MQNKLDDMVVNHNVLKQDEYRDIEPDSLLSIMIIVVIIFIIFCVSLLRYYCFKKQLKIVQIQTVQEPNIPP